MDFNSLQAESAGLGVLLARGAAKRAKVTLADHVDEMGDVTEKAIFRRPESTEMDAALDAVDDLFFATVSSDWDDAFTRAQAVFRDLDDDCQGALQAWREVEMIRRQVADGEMDPTIGRLSADMTLAAFGRSLGAPIFAAGAEPDGWDADGADILYAMVALSGRQTSAWEPEPQLPSLDHEIARADKPETLRKNASALGKNELGQNTLLRQSVKVDDQPWRVLDIAGLEGKPVPVREWIVPQWLPVKVVTLHYAGGVGKTLLALQLMAACASGGKWCGLRVTPCKSVGLFSEDDSDELHARIDSIRRHCSLSMDKLTDMCPIDGTGQDNTLVRFQRDGQMVLTPRFNRLRQQALDTKAKLVVIDTAATTFGGNEFWPQGGATSRPGAAARSPRVQRNPDLARHRRCRRPGITARARHFGVALGRGLPRHGSRSGSARARHRLDQAGRAFHPRRRRLFRRHAAEVREGRAASRTHPLGAERPEMGRHQAQPRRLEGHRQRRQLSQPPLSAKARSRCRVA
jgi:hypothetical protein